MLTIIMETMALVYISHVIAVMAICCSAYNLQDPFLIDWCIIRNVSFMFVISFMPGERKRSLYKAFRFLII